MSDYMDILSTYYKNMNTTSASQPYSAMLKSLAGTGSSTGLEGLSELGNGDDQSDFMSVLADYMSTSTADTIGNAANTAMADKLETALDGMDENSEAYDSVKDVYNYLNGLGSSSSLLNKLYRGSTETNSAVETGGNTLDSNVQSEGVQAQVNAISESDIENDIESVIENSINLSGLPDAQI